MARAGAVSPVPSCGQSGRSCRQFAKPCCGEWLASPLLRAIRAMRSGSGGRSSAPDRVTVKAVDGVPGELLNGLPGDTARLLAAAPVTDKRLLELSVTWTGQSRGRGQDGRRSAGLRHQLGSARVPGTPP